MKYLSFFILMLLSFCCKGQIAFSNKYISSERVGIINLQQNENFFNISGTIVPFSSSLSESRFFISSIDKNTGLPIWSYVVSVQYAELSVASYLLENKDNNKNINFLSDTKINQNIRTTLFLGDSTGLTGAIALPNLTYVSEMYGIQKDNVNAVAGRFGEDSLAICFFNQTGELLHQRNYLSQLLTNDEFYDLDIYEDNFYLSGNVGSHSYLFKDKIEGGEFSYRIFDRTLLEQIEVDVEGNIYATAVETYYIAGERFVRDRHLFKLNADLEILWTKTFNGTPQNASFRSLEITNTGEIITSLATVRNLVNYHFRFNSEGDLLSKKGIPIGDRSRWSNIDSSIMIATNRFFEDSPVEINEFILAKTNANIELPECPIYDVCIEMTEGFEPSYFDLSFTPFEYTMEVQPLAIISEPIEFEVEDICYTVPPPRADFILPDTLCRFNILTPTDVFNDTAEEVNWEISGGEIDTIFAEFPEDYSLNLAGDYEVTQTVSFFGCTESYTRMLTILDDLEVAFDTDSLICDSPPLILSAEGNRPLVDFLWDDSISTSTYEIYESGDYKLIASDGYCQDTTEQSLHFVFPEGFTPEFFVGNDTIVCFDNENLFLLRPSSNFTELFRFNGIEDSIFTVQSAGNYTFEAVIDDNCIFSENIQIENADCQSSIFLANVFSPNDDGINDNWKPLGKDFISQELLVFDRWGNQILQEKGGNLSWNGKVKGQLASQGVYIIVLKYLNTLTGKEEQASTDVTIIW